jgi:SPP1 gp7 family putative phage head morphogenesis protein
MNSQYPLHIEKQQEQIYAESIGKLSRAINKKVKDEYDNLDSAKFAEIENSIYAELTKLYLTTEFLSVQFGNIGKLLDAWAYSKLKNYINQAMRKNRNKFFSIMFEKDDPIIQEFMQGYVKKNIELVQALGKQYIPEITSLASKTFLEGGSRKDLAYEMLKFTDGNKNKAKFYASDQVGDAYSEFTRVRQTSVGITEYMWKTMGDNAVRDAHIELEKIGKFTWKSGAAYTGLLTKPGAKHPSEDYRCRCNSEPVIE